MMTRTMTGMLIVVLAMASSAHAAFNEDFEGYGPAGTDISPRNLASSPWRSMGWESYGQTATSTPRVKLPRTPARTVHWCWT